MKKRHIILLGIGISLCIVPFLINIYSIFRIISLILGIIFILVSLILKRKRSIFYIILIPLIMLVFSYGIDTLLIYTLKRIPIFSYVIESNKNVKTYNSLFYRIFDCDNELILDYGYIKSYACNTSLLDAININSFLQDTDATYKNYRHKFVHVYGKISKISGNESIELASFTQSDNSLNGYVNFNLDNILIVNTTQSLNKYKIYDYIDVFGEVDKISDGKISLINTKLVASEIYNDYSFEIISNDNKVLTNLVKENDYYYYGITSINIKYDQDNIYELSYLLLDGRLLFDDLIKNKEYITFKDDTSEETAKKYKLEKFDIIKCTNNRVVFASSNSNALDDVCSLDID